MYHRKIESNRAAKLRHDEQQKAAASDRLRRVAAQVKAKKAAAK